MPSDWRAMGVAQLGANVESQPSIFLSAFVVVVYGLHHHHCRRRPRRRRCIHPFNGAMAFCCFILCARRVLRMKSPRSSVIFCDNVNDDGVIMNAIRNELI